MMGGMNNMPPQMNNMPPQMNNNAQYDPYKVRKSSAI